MTLKKIASNISMAAAKRDGMTGIATSNNAVYNRMATDIHRTQAFQRIVKLFMLIWYAAITMLWFCGAAAAATVEIYPISYTDGFTPVGGRGVSIILPADYTEGEPRKWVIYLHGMGEDGVLITNTAYFKALVDEYGIILVTINSDPDNMWWDTDLWPAHHLEEGIALAKEQHDLTAYLPCLYGYSAGATKALTEMQQHPGLYSCFAASSIASDSIAMAQYSPIDFDALWGLSVFGGNHDSVDATVHARWMMYSPARTVDTADMRGRKVYIVHGSADSTTSAVYQYTPFVSAIPAVNLANATLVSGGGHVDYLENAAYVDGFFQFFADNSIDALNGHTVLLDGSGKIIPWTTDPAQGYDQVMNLAWGYLLNSVPIDSMTGKPAYYSRSYLSPDTQQPAEHPHNPAGLYGMLIESALKYYGYSGNIAAVNLAQDVARAQLNSGMTPTGWNWSNVPYASGDPGSLIYQGAAGGNTSGVGDGTGVIEPDKVGEMGYAWLQLYRFDGNTQFRDAAIAAADALAAHVRTGTSSQSPWPFRVYAQTGVAREDYCTDVIGPISLFDGLIKLGLGNTASYQAARDTAWNWMMTYPMQNNVWANYFEDVPIQTDLSNVNQYNAMMAARYLLEHPEYDADWENHVRGLITWVENTFAVPSYGANTIAEQIVFWHPMGSHTSRYASVNALLYEKIGEPAEKEKAYRSLNWATYMARSNGVVIDGPEVNNQWFTDGYGDYIRHFMTSMGAVPEWAPSGQNHLVRSSSIVKSINYLSSVVTYTTSDGSSTEVFRLNFSPTNVTVDGQALDKRPDLDQAGWTFDPVLNILRVRHDIGTNVEISQTLSSIAVTPVNPIIPAGMVQQFAATGTYTDGGTRDITGQVDWTSSDANVAVINSTGLATAVSPGSTTITARLDGVTDNANLTVEAIVDPTPPSAPTNLIAIANSQTQVNLTWTASTDNVGVAGYRIIRNGSQIGTSSIASYSDTTVAAGTTYSYLVRAYDAAGNVSADSNTATVTTPSAPSAPVLDKTVTTKQSTGSSSISSPAISTAQPNELLVAFITSDGPNSSGSQRITAVTGGGLTWTLRARANGQAGTAEIWTAPAVNVITNVIFTATRYSGSYQGMMTVAAFQGASLTENGAASNASASSGAPRVSLTSTRANSVVWGVADDWDNAITRTVSAGQTKLSEFLSPSGDTFWVQYLTAPVAVAGQAVTLSCTAPTTDRWNFAALEILPTTTPPGQDTTPPTVTAFTVPAVSRSLTVAISSLTATDDVGVTGYLVNESATAPAPADAGWATTAPASYTFATAGSKTLYAWAKDAAGNVSAGLSANVIVDVTAPVMTAFTIPATARSLTITITSLAATDNVGVTGYLVTEVSTAPSPTASGWSGTAPVSYTFLSAGDKTLYAWAKDAAGNVSTSRSAVITIDTTVPIVTDFIIPITSETLTVAITSFTASDNVGVTGYLITELATAPSPTASGWSGTAPGTYTFPTTGEKTLYAWAIDAAGNVSTSRSASVTITIPDTTPPNVTAFDLPAASNTLTVPITTFIATDNVGVTGYLLTEVSTAPSSTASGWSGAAPASYTFLTAGDKTLYAWAKDAAGNVSTSRSAAITIDTTVPIVTDFSIPVTAETLTVPINSFVATDNRGVTGYQVTELATAPSPTASGWSTAVPVSYTFLTAGVKTLYAWAKDAVGNVSASRSASVTITIPDLTPPTAPSNLAATAVGQTRVDLTWTASIDNIGVTGYQVVRNGSQIATSTTTTYSDTTVSAGMTYEYLVRAYDAAGNVSTNSNIVSVTTPTAPSYPVFDKAVTTKQATGSTTISSPAISTAQPNELLVAFIASDGPNSAGSQRITAVSGGGLTWTLRARANAQAGTAEIWTAPAANVVTNVIVTATRYNGSWQGMMTVAAFQRASLAATGAAANASASTGAPRVTLTTTQANSLVWAIGDDWDRAVARTVGANQTKQSEYLAPAGDTFWVQYLTAPVPAAGTLTTINCTAPTNDRWNFAALEIIPQ